jgi:hypothetical protein
MALPQFNQEIPTWGLSFPWRKLKIVNGECLGPSPIRVEEFGEVGHCSEIKGSWVGFEER